MRTLIISKDEEAAIADVIAHAERERFTEGEMLARQDCKKCQEETLEADMQEKDPNRTSIRRDLGHVCALPGGFLCCFTIEQQPVPLGWCRHISVQAIAGGPPQTDEMDRILKAFGFRYPLLSNTEGKTRNIHYPQGDAVNVVEPMEDIPE